MKSLELTDENIERVRKRALKLYAEPKLVKTWDQALKQALEEERQTVDTFTVRITHSGVETFDARKIRGVLTTPGTYFLVKEGGIITDITVEPVTDA